MVNSPRINRSHTRDRGHVLGSRLTGCSLLFLLIFAPSALFASNLVYKNYVVRYDRGWDILCEPYVVQKGDWITKIFNKKGEIANKDYREFIGIFQRLNPHVQDINMIRPGQSIDIPLRKLEHGALPGQSSGVVTIPFVTLTEVKMLLHRSMQQYQVQSGDTISQLIARRFGKFGSESYKEGVKLIQAANPQITNLDRIYAGQKIYMPDPTIREKSWYDALYDENGNLREKLGSSQAQAGAPTPGEQSQFKPQGASAEPEPPKSNLEIAAATVGGRLVDKGTYYLPRQSGKDFEVDLSRNPMLDLGNNQLLFTQDGSIMGESPDTVQAQWPQTRVIDYDENTPPEKILENIFAALEGDSQGQPEPGETGFELPGLRIHVRAKWIKPDQDQRMLCITPIDSPSEQTPEPMRRLMEQHGIVIKEILPGGPSSHQVNPGGGQRHTIKNILSLTPNSQESFVQSVARSLKFTYAPNVPVTFAYAGIQIKAYANLVTSPTGNETLVDFGGLYGDALEEIRKSGLNVIRIEAEDSYASVLRKILDALGATYEQDPSFLVAQRPPQFNSTVTIEGLLYKDRQNQRTFLTGTDLPAPVSDLLGAQGLAVVTW